MTDRGIPSIRIAMFVVIIGSVSLSSYLIAKKALTRYGIPTSENISNFRPKLIVVGDDLLLATDVEIGYGFEILRKGQVCLANLTTEGCVVDTKVILDLRGDYLSTMDLLITTDEKWYMVYQTHGLGDVLYQGHELKFIRSDDGKSWEKPVVIFKAGFKSPDFYDVSLTEGDDGEIFLCYRKWNREIENYTVFFSKYTPQDGWRSQEETTFHWKGVSSFLDKDGVISIVGVEYSDDYPFSMEGGYEVPRIYMTRMEDGTWTEQKNLNYDGGIKSEIFYSYTHDGYFLMTNGDSWVGISFSQGLESWSIPITFLNARRPALAELPNGILVLVFERRFEFPPDAMYAKVWIELYISTSNDGVNWTTPRKVETIVDDEGLETVLSNRRSVASAFASIPVAVCVILILYKRNFGFRQPQLKNNGNISNAHNRFGYGQMKREKDQRRE